MKINIPLDITKDRPVVILPKMKAIRAMVDTSALFPVWVQEEEDLKLLGAKMIKAGVSFSVFGGYDVTGNLYQIDSFVIDDNYFFPAMPVVAARDETLNDVAMLLPSTLFRGTSYGFDIENAQMVISVLDNQPSRRIVIQGEAGERNVLYSDK